MKYLLAILILIASVGCTPVEGFVNGQFAGSGGDNALHQMEFIVRNAVIVYDPGMTSAEFDAWVADHEYNKRRFIALFRLYAAIVPAGEHDLDAITRLRKAMVESDKALTRAQYAFYAE